MFLKDAEGRITFWSAGAKRLFGWSEAEIFGRPGDILFTPEDREHGEPEGELGRARATGQALDRRWHLRKDGSRFWADGLLMRLNDEAGNLRGFAKVTRDATEQKQAEDELHASEEAVRRANEELERRVNERTRALAERTEELAHMSEMRQELLRQLVTAQEEERGRISRDLHDDTGQQVTALLLGLNHLKTASVLESDAEAQEMLTRLQAHAVEVAKKSHQLSFTLRPTDLDDIGLMGALQNYVYEWSGWSGLPVDLQSVGLETAEGEAARLPPEIETTIYRVTQEALTNVLRHAVVEAVDSDGIDVDGANDRRRASQVSIVVQWNGATVITTIEDDGPGFDVEAVLNLPPGKRRLGIFGMQERARLAGGTLSVESEPGAGTTVFLRLPLPAVP
jgi:PAS domain S-box-containing protein